MTIEIGYQVERIAKDYTGGRQGNVIEVDNVKGRARVNWTKEKGGEPMKLRTWVRFQDLKILVVVFPKKIDLVEGENYTLIYGRKKLEVYFRYNGLDHGGNHFFVNAKACFRVAPSQLESVFVK